MTMTTSNDDWLLTNTLSRHVWKRHDHYLFICVNCRASDGTILGGVECGNPRVIDMTYREVADVLVDIDGIEPAGAESEAKKLLDFLYRRRPMSVMTKDMLKLIVQGLNTNQDVVPTFATLGYANNRVVHLVVEGYELVPKTR